MSRKRRFVNRNSDRKFVDQTKDALDQMIVSMRRAGSAHNTIATYVRLIRAFRNWANQEGMTAVMLPTGKDKGNLCSGEAGEPESPGLYGCQSC